MNDRIPGSTWDNPIWYKGYRIYIGEPQYGNEFTFAFTHDDFDGAPDSKDRRHGYAPTIEAAKAEIDEREE